MQFDMLININHYISTHNTQTQIVITKYVSIKPIQRNK